MDDARRLTVNPDPLRVVDARPGAAPERGHVLAVKPAKGASADDCTLRRVSVHRTGCPRIPSARGWVVKAASREEVSRLLGTVDEETEIEVQVSVSCRTCGGWSALP